MPLQVQSGPLEGRTFVVFWAQGSTLVVAAALQVEEWVFEVDTSSTFPGMSFESKFSDRMDP